MRSAALIILLFLGEPVPEPGGAGPAGPADLTDIAVSGLVTRVLEDPLIDPAELTDRRIFHGQWEQLGELDTARQARLKLLRYERDDAMIVDDAVDPLIRAEAALRYGDPERALELLDAHDSAQAALLRARAHEQRGALADAVADLAPLRDHLHNETITDAAELTAAAEALVMLARLEGRPDEDWQTAIGLLGKVRADLDPLYWPAPVAEARLLIEKDNRSDALEALTEALGLNPKCSQAWYMLGTMAVDSFDFDRARRVALRLRDISEDHLLADLLDARSYLTQKDVASARTIVEAAGQRHPAQRELLAYRAALEAMSYDDAALAEALGRFEELAPGSPLAHLVTGRFLSMARQYDAAEAMLREGIDRQPNAAEPRIELGLLLMQAGRNEDALTELRRAHRLDKFHRRAGNSLRLVEQLLDYETIETDHFVIRYKPGVDRVLAADMPETLETIYSQITGVFEHEPDVKTQIDILPDEKSFGVRITGMPEIWTIAACTGPLIALTPPREGTRQRGSFDWANVIRHEFVHTVTLGQTGNRVPHWFTEACAVSQEAVGRSFDTSMLLAVALHADELFGFDQINWAFIRPRSPRDRPLAYAQADWMLEFIAYRHGHRAIVDMLNRFRTGAGDTAVLSEIIGQSPEQFMAEFDAWARQQVESWGLAPEQSEQRGRLRREAEAALDGDDPLEARRAVLRYADACPADDWSHEALLRLALEREDASDAIAALETLDARETSSGDLGHQLATLHRAADRLDAAAGAIRRALHREPYNPGYRELAATIELQRGNPERALTDLEGLALLEPDRAMHHVRLAAIYTKVGREAEARQAAERARELDPDAPVGKFLEGNR